MFAEVFKKDSLQDEEYAECYVFDKTMLLSKTDLESYSTCDYDENIIRNFHQKQSSYAQSEGYHSYVSSNDSAIIAQFTDRSQLENDTASVDEPICSSKDCGSGGDCRSSSSSIDAASKLHNSYNSCNVKGVSYERCNSQHIAHSARVQTPQRHYSESVQYLSTHSGPGSAIGAPIMPSKPYYQQSCSSERPDQKHGSASAINSQLRKLYPVNTYCIQPNSCPSVASSFSKVCDSTSNASKLSSCSKKSFFESENMQCAKQNELCGARATAEYTFLDPSKQRVVSNQNLKNIQKQALISYYERHHSTWRSEPQLSTNSSMMSVSQSRPRMPSPTSCHSLCPAQNDECIDTDKNPSLSTAPSYTADNLASDHPASIIGHIPESGSYINNRWKLTTTTTTTKTTQQCISSTQIGIPFDEERVPELPPKKNHLSLQTTARRLSSPDLPPPSPPPILDDEIYVPDEPFPPPPMAVCEETSAASAFICDTPKVPEDPKSLPFGETPSKCTPSKIDSKLRTRTRTNSMYESSTSKFSKSSRSMSSDADQRCAPQQPPGFVSRRVATAVKCIDDGKVNCTSYVSTRKPANVSRFSSSSFRTYKRSASESMVSSVEKFPAKMSVQPSPSSVTLCDNANRTKLPSHIKGDAPPPNASSNHIEQKVKAIRTLFEDKLKKSNFQFPSFSFIHSEKFPSKLDPRFPRTSYQLSQSSNHREFRDCEKGEIFNAVGIYKRTTSPMRSVNDYDSVKSCVVINDPQPHPQQAQIQPQSAPYPTRSPIMAPLPPSINNHTIQPPLATIDQSPPCYRAIPSLTTDLPLPSTFTPPLPSPTLSLTAISPVTEEDRILTALRVSSNVEITETVDEPPVGHYLIQSSPQDFCERATIMDDFDPVPPPVQPRSQSISPSDQLVRTVTSTNPSNDSILRLHDDIPHSDDSVDDTCREIDCHRVAAIPVLIEDDDSIDLANSKNNSVTIDAASQTDVNVQMALPPPVPPLPSSSRSIVVPSVLENEIEKLRIEVMDELTPTNRLYKILEAPKLDSKTPTDYLENIFDPDVVLPVSIMQKNLSHVRQSQDTRLQEGSIAYGECVFQLPQEMNTKLNISEDCDNFQNMTRCTTSATTTALNTPVGILQEKKNALVKYLTRQLDTLKSELDTITQESRKNEEQGVVIWQQIMQSLSAREASKYKLHFQEVGQITSLLLGLGARLAKVENSLQDLPQQPDSQTEKKILENRRSQLVQQLEDAKELKNDIDKRSALLTSLLHKYFNQQQITQYHQFIRTKCQLLIYNRNLNDTIFTIEQQVNALNEDQIQPYSNPTYSCNK